MNRRVGAGLWATAVIACLCFAPSASAAPANDNFASAQQIASEFPVSVSGTSSGATAEPSEPAHGGSPANVSVWYSWTSPESGAVRVRTCPPPSGDTRLGVYTGGAVNALTQVASDDNGCAGGAPFATASLVEFNAVAGTTYRIAVDGVPGSFTLEIESLHPPANDNFAAAHELGRSPSVSQRGWTRHSTRESGEPAALNNDLGPNHGSVWYRWTAPSSGPVRLDVCDSTTDQIEVRAFTGTSATALTPVGVADHDCGGGYDRIEFEAVESTTYRFAVYGSSERQASTTFTDPGVKFTLRLEPIARPPNDNFAAAQVVGPALPVRQGGTTVDASREAGEPSGASRSVWYRWTAPASGPVRVSGCRSGGGMAVGVYTGSSVSALTQVASGSGCGPQSGAELEAVAGVTYRIAVDGGEYEFTLVLESIARPANDNLAAAHPIGPGLPVSQPGTTVDASAEPGEPARGSHPASRSVWYSWTAPAAGRVRIETCDAGFDPVIGVYTGSSMAGLAAVPANESACSIMALTGRRLELDVVAGTTYKIAVDAAGGYGDFTLNAQWLPPSNDNFGGARAIGPAVPISQAGTNSHATAQSGEPSHAGRAATRSVWYRWTPEFSYQVRIHTCAADFDTLLAVYTGSSFSDLTSVASNDDGCGRSNFGSRVEFTARVGTTYSIAVDGYNGASGNFTLELRPAIAPSNDNFASARMIGPALPVSQAGDNSFATAEGLEPGHAGSAAAQSVWYSWTANVTRRIRVDTCTAEFDTRLAVYTGPRLGELTPIESNDDACGTSNRASSLVFAATEGVTYRIAVDGYGVAQGRFTLAMNVTPLPEVPVISSSDPASPANDNAPRIRGTAQPGTTVQLYSDSACTTPLGAPAASTVFADPGIQIAVPDNSTTQIHARATNIEGSSPCSGAFTYREDSQGPTPPVLIRTDPPSGYNNNTPRIIGTADPESTMVRLFKDPRCEGPVAGEGARSVFVSNGLRVPVSDNSVTHFSANAIDQAGNVSACSSPLSYREASPSDQCVAASKTVNAAAAALAAARRALRNARRRGAPAARIRRLGRLVRQRQAALARAKQARQSACS